MSHVIAVSVLIFILLMMVAMGFLISAFPNTVGAIGAVLLIGFVVMGLYAFIYTIVDDVRKGT